MLIFIAFVVPQTMMSSLSYLFLIRPTGCYGGRHACKMFEHPISVDLCGVQTTDGVVEYN
jgi:hypothetical protein